MAAALTIVVLLALSVLIVRIAGVAMRLTGLADNVARFQCISALTGTGYSTHESEMIVNYPIRRRILIAVMILGNLGMVSFASAFIVTFINTESEFEAIMRQVLTMAGTIIVTLLLLTNKTLDKLMCDFIGLVLSKITDLQTRHFQTVLQMDDGYSIVEHAFLDHEQRKLGDLPLDTFPLQLLSIRKAAGAGLCHDFDEDVSLVSGDVLICYGSDEAHSKLGRLTIAGLI